MTDALMYSESVSELLCSGTRYISSVPKKEKIICRQLASGYKVSDLYTTPLECVYTLKKENILGGLFLNLFLLTFASFLAPVKSHFC